MENNKLINNRKPEGDIHVVYFSSISENTKKFCEKLGFENSRIPIDKEKELNIDKDFVLICPTYAGGLTDYKGCVPRQVIKFLNKENNRKHCVAVVSSGNTNFGDTFALAGPVLSKKLQVPLLHQFELLGTMHDIEVLQQKIKDLWNK